MWLFIDSSERGRLRLAHLPVLGTIRAHDHVADRYSMIRELSSFIPVKQLKDLKGICVVHGPGSFSAVRSGVLAANVMARILRIPLFGIDRSEAEDLESVRDRLMQGSYRAQTYVAPIYDAEPNITVPRSSSLPS